MEEEIPQCEASTMSVRPSGGQQQDRSSRHHIVPLQVFQTLVGTALVCAHHCSAALRCFAAFPPAAWFGLPGAI